MAIDEWDNKKSLLCGIRIPVSREKSKRGSPRHKSVKPAQRSDVGQSNELTMNLTGSVDIILGEFP